MTKPLGFYVDGEIPLDLLKYRFGEQLEEIEPIHKLALMNILGHSLYCQLSGEKIKAEDAVAELRYNLPAPLGGMLETLDELSQSGRLGLFEAIIAQLRNGNISLLQSDHQCSRLPSVN